MEDLKKLERELLDNMLLIKEDYIRTKDEIMVSIRRDVVNAELKDILHNSKDYEELYKNISIYAQNLLKN